MDIANILGMAAGTLTTASFVPQVFKLYKSKSSKDVSMTMFITLGTGVSLWVAYGLLVCSLPVILANSCTLGLVLVLIFLKLRYRHNE